MKQTTQTTKDAIDLLISAEGHYNNALFYREQHQALKMGVKNAWSDYALRMGDEATTQALFLLFRGA
jgi:hypothetical protein